MAIERASWMAFMAFDASGWCKSVAGRAGSVQVLRRQNRFALAPHVPYSVGSDTIVRFELRSFRHVHLLSARTVRGSNARSPRPPRSRRELPMKPLVESMELAAHRSWRVFDCRHVLTDPDKGREFYAAGHIPGALTAHLDEDLSGPKTGRNGRHPLPSSATFTGWLGACGVNADDTVVAYDESGGIFAARLWWMLRWIGHPRAAVLNGGLGSWVEEGLPLETMRPAFARTTYVVRPVGTNADGIVPVDVAEVVANLARPEFQLVDARAASRFAGRDETLDPVGGHIPHALNRPFADNLEASGRFKAPARLRAEFATLLGARTASSVVHQCGSGVTACHNVLAMEVADLGGSRLYPGSWSEWCSDPTRPVSVGAV